MLTSDETIGELRANFCFLVVLSEAKIRNVCLAGVLNSWPAGQIWPTEPYLPCRTPQGSGNLAAVEALRASPLLPNFQTHGESHGLDNKHLCTRLHRCDQIQQAAIAWPDWAGMQLDQSSRQHGARSGRLRTQPMDQTCASYPGHRAKSLATPALNYARKGTGLEMDSLIL